MEKKPTVVGIVRWRRVRKALSYMRQHPWQGAWLALLAVVLVANLGFAAFWLYQQNNRPQKKELPVDNGYERTIKELESQPFPQDPMDQVYYYSQIAHSYEALEKYDKALEFYLKGQETVERHNLHAQASFYVAISNMYEKLGDNRKTKEYNQKAAEHLEQYPGEVPPDVIEARLE